MKLDTQSFKIHIKINKPSAGSFVIGLTTVMVAGCYPKSVDKPLLLKDWQSLPISLSQDDSGHRDSPYVRPLSELNSREAILLHELQQAPKSHKRERVLKAWEELGLVNYEKHELTSAEKWLLLAINTRAETLGEKSNDLHIIQDLYLLADCYRFDNKLNIAVSSLQRANRLLQRWVAEDNYRLACNILSALSTCYEELGDKSKSLSYASKQLEIYKQFNDTEGIQSTYRMLAEKAEHFDNLKLAIKYWKQQAPPETSKDKARYASHLGFLYEQIGDLPRAKTCTQAALLQLEQSSPKNHLEILNELDSLIRIKQKMGSATLNEKAYRVTLIEKLNSKNLNHIEKDDRLFHLKSSVPR